MTIGASYSRPKEHRLSWGQDQTRGVPGKEREKNGMGKKLERNAFFPFPFLHFLTTFFPILAKIVKNG